MARTTILRSTLAFLVAGCAVPVAVPVAPPEGHSEARSEARAERTAPPALERPVARAATVAPPPPAFVPWQPPSPSPPVATAAPAPLPVEVRVAPELLVMTAGEARDLQASVVHVDGTVDANVTWSSSDARIVAVNPTTGRVQARQAGVATVVVASAVAPARRALVTVTVHRGQVEEALVRVEPAVARLRVGETLPLTASVQLTDGTLSPNVGWVSANRGVVLVSGTGLVTAVGPGRATVTATAAGDATRRASCEVTVAE